jgi:glycosyltransferase involved in cell wall biosynthesis
MSGKSNLLVVNYVMDSQDSLLSHQLEAVRSLAHNFNRVTVITGKIGRIEIPDNVRVISSEWIKGQRIRNMLRLLKISLPIIARGNFTSAFFHMTDLQCAVLSPFIRLRHKKQCLWYAHTSNSFYLKWSSKWVNFIITSTAGSCPATGPKVFAIGQAIDSNNFAEIPLVDLDLNKLIHIGRFDKSKNIELLIVEAKKLRQEFEYISLTIVGSPANEESTNWSQDLMQRHSREISNQWLKFSKAIPRDQFPRRMAENGCFFHAYVGSLDKTLVESTMLRVPVVTVNPEYISHFGRWSSAGEVNLVDEYKALRSLTFQEIDKEMIRRRTIAMTNHSLTNWTSRLTQMLQ